MCAMMNVPGRADLSMRAPNRPLHLGVGDTPGASRQEPCRATAWFAGKSEKGVHDVYRLVSANQAELPVRAMCRVLKVSASGFHDWQGRQPCARAKANAELTKCMSTPTQGRGVDNSLHLDRGLVQPATQALCARSSIAHELREEAQRARTCCANITALRCSQPRFENQAIDRRVTQSLKTGIVPLAFRRSPAATRSLRKRSMLASPLTSESAEVWTE